MTAVLSRKLILFHVTALAAGAVSEPMQLYSVRYSSSQTSSPCSETRLIANVASSSDIGIDSPTNNRPSFSSPWAKARLMSAPEATHAVVEALQLMRYPMKVWVSTRSSYMKKGTTEWIHNWKRNR
jgi:hypothetical protein